ncbi:MAG: hypothetical protein KME27_10765 [Lyngbya sp. HA4199-MV5]|jgi:hypothetical protein|nr:hypothetical protein [Lyngbya sp. HA4199-MV5]
MNTSLTKFCRDNKLSKTTVHRRCQELNLDITDGLNPVDLDMLMHEFDLKPVVEASPVTVEVGNHQIVLGAPQLPQTYTLEGLRVSEVQTYEDPLALAAQFINAADQLETSMAVDIQQREQKLQQTKQAAAAIAAKRQKLELEARLYQMETNRLHTATNAETVSLTEGLTALQSLGKSQD